MIQIQERADVAYARVFAEMAHQGQFRTSVTGVGESYFLHVLRVAKGLHEKGFSFAYIVTGLFHDIYEDTKITKDSIFKIIGNDEMAEVIHQSMLLLTKASDIKDHVYGMHMYIKNIKTSTITSNVVEPHSISIPLAVKLEDRLDNLRSALDNTLTFAAKYIKETEKHFLSLAEGTIYEEEIAIALYNLKLHYEESMCEVQPC